ncbi:MAG: hypothetical protein PHU43_05215 [Candidatus Bipolaricaulis sp.]|nr:hypothetical protein [Candidatus Bipolaricaulis sp.]
MQSRVEALALAAVVLWMGCLSTSASPTFGEILTEATLGLLGGAAGAALSIAAVGEIAPLVPSPLSGAAVVATLALGTGAGASIGVLVAGDLLDRDARPLPCLVGGLLGGLAAALAEPILGVLGVPAPVAEFLGFALLPILPAVGATLGLHLAPSP